MNSDFEELLRAFNENGVRYLVVGGYAVMLYPEPRYTKDWISGSKLPMKMLAKCFRLRRL
jgi:hypothetical protein